MCKLFCQAFFTIYCHVIFIILIIIYLSLSLYFLGCRWNSCPESGKRAFAAIVERKPLVDRSGGHESHSGRAFMFGRGIPTIPQRRMPDTEGEAAAASRECPCLTGFMSRRPRTPDGRGLAGKGARSGRSGREEAHMPAASRSAGRANNCGGFGVDFGTFFAPGNEMMI